MNIFKKTKTLINNLRKPEPLTFYDGYIAAADYMLDGASPEELRKQAEGDRVHNKFKDGWIAATKAYEK